MTLNSSLTSMTKSDGFQVIMKDDANYKYEVHVSFTLELSSLGLKTFDLYEPLLNISSLLTSKNIKNIPILNL